MQNTSSAGSEENVGSIPALPKLNPREIAVMQLPGFTVQIMDSTDAEFQYFVTRSGIEIQNDEPDTMVWSFDDKCRFINHARKYGVDVFTIPNKNNSLSEQNQFANNSETIPDGELIDGSGIAPQAKRDDFEYVPIPNASALTEMINSMLDNVENSSANEQNTDHSSSSGE